MPSILKVNQTCLRNNEDATEHTHIRTHGEHTESVLNLEPGGDVESEYDKELSVAVG